MRTIQPEIPETKSNVTEFSGKKFQNFRYASDGCPLFREYKESAIQKFFWKLVNAINRKRLSDLSLEISGNLNELLIEWKAPLEFNGKIAPLEQIPTFHKVNHECKMEVVREVKADEMIHLFTVEL